MAPKTKMTPGEVEEDLRNRGIYVENNPRQSKSKREPQALVTPFVVRKAPVLPIKERKTRKKI